MARTRTRSQATVKLPSEHSASESVPGDDTPMCGGKVPMFVALAILATVVVAAFVTLLLVLDNLQQDAAKHAAKVAIRGALDFSVTAVASIFEETRMLGLRLAKDRQTGTAPSCGNTSIPLRTAVMALAATRNASKVDVFAVYDTFQPADVPQALHNLSYSICAATSTVMQYMPSPPRVAEYTILPVPQVVGAFTGFFPAAAWNQTDERYVKHQMTMRPDAMAVGDWSLPEFFIHPATNEATMYLSFHVPVAFDGPTAAPSASVSIDLLGTGFLPTLRLVQLERTNVILVDPRPDPLAVGARTDLLLATTFATVPTLSNRSGSPALWYADETPEPLLNAAVVAVRSSVGQLSAVQAPMQIDSGPDDTVLGAAPVVRAGNLKLLLITLTPHDVFEGNLRRGRTISAAVGTSCGVVCLLSLCALILITNSAARGLLQHIAGSGRRDTTHAPKDSDKAFAVAFTDIQASTSLWARLPQVMGPALDLHHQVLRDCVKLCRGYEVKTIGDSFMVAFKEAEDALNFALQVQGALHKAAWGTEAFDAEYAELIATAYPELALNVSATSSPGPLWNGIRVRVGVHYGHGTITEDEVTGGYDYYGTVVNTAARVEGVAHGGQVLVTDALVAGLPSGALAAHDIEALGPQPLRGLDHPVSLTQVLPMPFAKRTFPPLRLDVEVDVTAAEAELLEATDTPTGAAYRRRSMTSSTSVVSTRGLYKQHRVQMSYDRFTLCCDTLRAVLGPLATKQRMQWVTQLAQKWRLDRISSEDAAIAAIVARASLAIGGDRDVTRHQSGISGVRSVETMSDGSLGSGHSGRSRPQIESLLTTPTVLGPVP